MNPLYVFVLVLVGWFLDLVGLTHTVVANIVLLTLGACCLWDCLFRRGANYYQSPIQVKYDDTEKTSAIHMQKAA